MKLLFILNSFGGSGGIAKITIGRFNYLAEIDNFEIHVLIETRNYIKEKDIINPKIKIHQLEIEKQILKKRIPILGYFQLQNEIGIKLQAFIDQLKPEIITNFNFGYSTEIIPKLKTGAYKIIEFHGSFFSRKELKKRKSPIEYFKINPQKLHNHYDIGITITEEDLKDRKYLKTKSIYIFNPIVDVQNKVSQFTTRKNICLSVGILTKNKNFRDLILAVDLIKEKINNWEFHIYGEGSERSNLKELIDQKNLSNLIKLKGFCTDMDKVYNQSKLLISTSLSEGFGLTMVEALSYKIPVIAYNCKCGPKEIVKDGVNGYLIDFSVQELAQRILELTSDSEKLESFSSHCYDEIDRFDFKKIMNQWIEFYESVVKNMS